MPTIDTLQYTLSTARGSALSVHSRDDTSRAYARGACVITNTVLSQLVQAYEADTLGKHHQAISTLVTLLGDNWRDRHEDG